MPSPNDRRLGLGNDGQSYPDSEEEERRRNTPREEQGKDDKGSDGPGNVAIRPDEAAGPGNHLEPLHEKREAKGQLETANDALRNNSIEPVDEAGEPEHEDDEAHRSTGSENLMNGEPFGESNGSNGLHRLNGHRDSEREAGDDVEQPGEEEGRREVERVRSSRNDTPVLCSHADQERQERPHIAKGPSDLMAIEPRTAERVPDMT